MNASNRYLFWFCCFLVATVLAGLVLRWQLAGLASNTQLFLDWRRAHSHTGFYGVLFPLAWICLQQQNFWLPGPKIWLSYISLVALGGFAFLFQSYGFFSIAASTGILFIWLFFVWKNRAHFNLLKKNWLAPALSSILLSTGLIAAVAILTDSNPTLANQLARSFLTILLFGVFLPASLKLLNGPAPFALLWFLSTFASALYLTDLISNPLLGLGPLFLSFTILKTVFQSENKDFRLRFAWCLFAIALGLTGIGLFPYSYNQAIAGIHFFILGPLLMTLTLVRLQLYLNSWLRAFYELSLITMTLGISFQNKISFSLHTLIALSGTAVVVSLLLILGFAFFESLQRKIERPFLSQKT